MSTAAKPLHTVNKSPFASPVLADCLNRLGEGDGLLLIEDGVYGALAAGGLADRLAAVAKTHPVYVLAPDLAARGLSERPLVAGIGVVDYQGFVALAASHSAVVAWF